MYITCDVLYHPLNGEITDGVVDINVKCKHSMIAGNVVGQGELFEGIHLAP